MMRIVEYEYFNNVVLKKSVTYFVGIHMYEILHSRSSQKNSGKSEEYSQDIARKQNKPRSPNQPGLYQNIWLGFDASTASPAHSPLP